MWFIIAAVSFFLLAVAAVTDKFLLTKSQLVPISFVFIVSCLGALASSILIFFEAGFYFPSEHLIVLLIGGAGFYFALYFMYLAVVKREISRVNPLINSLAPVFIFLLAVIFSVEQVSGLKILGGAIVIAGGYLLSQTGLIKTRLKKEAVRYIILAALMFALSNTFSKIAYENISFITAFVWMKWITLAAALIFTTLVGAWPKIFVKSKDQKSSIRKNPWPALAVGQLSGGVAVILFQYAVSLGSVTIISALQGMQYFFLLLLTIILSKRFPQILKEAVGLAVIKKKFLYSLFLAIGVILILI